MKTNDESSAPEIFERALKIKSPAERRGFLNGACGDNAALREKIEALIASHADDSFLEDPAIIAPETIEGTSLSEGPGTTIGRYKLLQKIGEGGMGAVFMAEQTEPVRRKVALKIIKLGMDTKSVVARFEAERQALALMDHPNIAKVLDAGATETGRPFFVMELVKGVPVTTYCDRNNLSAKERLDLFVPVCQAIQHAHHKGIIHRDIKPSNILITLNDGVPHPMVIDFGIAKATNQRLTEKTLFTNYAQMIGTPAYMSPEQAEMSKLDVDTRSDVYSLGVLLYELLTGTTPFPEKELLSKGYGEMQRIITEQDPQRPSLRMSTLEGELQTVIANNRSTEALSLSKQLRGDLDWIVMKALEKDRTRRYDTVNGLASDIQNHLTDQPISAAQPRLSYRLRKLYRRERTLVNASIAIAACLVIGATIATLQYLKADQARKVALKARGEALQAQEAAELAISAEQTQRADAEKQRLITNRVNQFLVNEILNQADGNLQVDSNLTLIEAIKNATKRVDEAMPEDSLEKAAIMIALHNMSTTRRVPNHDNLLSGAYRIRKTLLGPDHPETLKVLVSWLLPTTLQNAALEAYRLYYPTLSPTSEIAIGLAGQRCYILRNQGRSSEIIDDTKALVDTARVNLGLAHITTHSLNYTWGRLLLDQGKHPEYFDHWRQIWEELKGSHPKTFYEWRASQYAAAAAKALGNYQFAIDRWTADIERQDNLLGGNRLAITQAYVWRALATYGQGNTEQAIRDLQPAFSIPVIQSDRGSLGQILGTQINILAMSQQLGQAIALMRDSEYLNNRIRTRSVPLMIQAKAWDLYRDAMHQIKQRLDESQSAEQSAERASDILINLLVSEPKEHSQTRDDIQAWIKTLEPAVAKDPDKDDLLALGLGSARIGAGEAARKYLYPLTQPRSAFSYRNNLYNARAALAHIILALVEMEASAPQQAKQQLANAESHARKVGLRTFLHDPDSYFTIIRLEILRDEVRKGLGMEASPWKKSLPQGQEG